MKTRLLAFAWASFIGLAAGGSLLQTLPSVRAASPAAAAARPAHWAQPVAVPGLPNLHKVSDDLYRCAQPEAEGFAKLKTLGVKTVVNLRSFHTERNEIAAAGLGYEHITMKAWHPEEKEVVRFLRIMAEPSRRPVLVHCQHGADRTGTMCAIYRIAVQGWTKEEAIREMTQGGFGFHGVWENLVRYVNGLDVEQIKQKVAKAN